MSGKILAVCVSRQKGTRKKNINRAYLRKDFGIKSDAHSGFWHRQISLLTVESIKKLSGLKLKVGPGDFAENLTTRGIELDRLRIGSRLRVGKEALLEVTQIGKICHSECEIKKLSGACIMPREGVFAKVLKSGWVNVNDKIEIYE